MWTADASAAKQLLTPDTPRKLAATSLARSSPPARSSAAALVSFIAASEVCGVSVTVDDGAREAWFNLHADEK